MHRDTMKKLITDHAFYAAAHTSCKRKGVACATINEHGEVQWFYNGPINDDGGFCSGERGNCGCIHAEFPAIQYCIWNNGYYGHEPKYQLLCNYSPCTSCANLIVVSKCISRIYYVNDTEHDMRGIKHVQRAGIEVIKLD